MNMCMICDNTGNVLALDKVNDSYTGTTFPGGHVEKNEIFNDSVIREVWEETGLKIEGPKLRGVYHWHRDAAKPQVVKAGNIETAFTLFNSSRDIWRRKMLQNRMPDMEKG